jgi:hypothetical protein
MTKDGNLGLKESFEQAKAIFAAQGIDVVGFKKAVSTSGYEVYEPIVTHPPASDPEAPSAS